jgi:hypothetical protein
MRTFKEIGEAEHISPSYAHVVFKRAMRKLSKSPGALRRLYLLALQADRQNRNEASACFFSVNTGGSIWSTGSITRSIG